MPPASDAAAASNGIAVGDSSSFRSSRLPLVVQANASEARDWMSPEEIQEALRSQPSFVCPDYRSLLNTALMLFLPGLLFMRWLLVESFGTEVHRAPRVGRSCVKWCSSWALGVVLGFASSACRNPGVVPHASARPDEVTKPQNPDAPVPVRWITLNGARVKRRWCSTCRVFRPLRAKHCSYCNRCVFHFDHHCSWLGNCVGIGNYRSFLFLILATALFFGHSAHITLQVVRSDMHEAHVDGFLVGRAQVLRRLFFANGLKSLYFLYAVLTCFAFSLLILYHGHIITNNLTTNEHVCDYYIERNPFCATCWENYRQVLCFPYGRILPAGVRPATSVELRCVQLRRARADRSIDSESAV